MVQNSKKSSNVKNIYFTTLNCHVVIATCFFGGVRVLTGLRLTFDAVFSWVFKLLSYNFACLETHVCTASGIKIFSLWCCVKFSDSRQCGPLKLNRKFWQIRTLKTFSEIPLKFFFGKFQNHGALFYSRVSCDNLQ